MSVPPGKKIVLLGMMTKIPVAGEVWETLHFLIGLRRLGYEPYYVESHACTPSIFMETEQCDGSRKAADFLDVLLRRFDFGHNWAFHALHEERPRVFGLSAGQLRDLYRDAALIINFHGGTVPLPEHYASGRLIYLETDPVQLQVGLYYGRQEDIEFLAPHVAFFSWGLNYGKPDCRVPLPECFPFQTSAPVVVPDLWWADDPAEPPLFTTVGSWKQTYREVTFQGEVYSWSKHLEFLKLLDLPARTPQPFELALSSCGPTDRDLLRAHGWRVRSAAELSWDLNAYRHYVATSRGEFTVAKDQNVRLRSGWFSERSAQYLAAGRPVITQETGFSNALPTGRGLFGFSTLDEIVAAVNSINGDYRRHRRAAAEVARDYFSYDVVLPRLLGQVGL